MKFFLLILITLIINTIQNESLRNLKHLHLQTGHLYGNSTDLQYFYVDLYVGEQRQKQSLIVDTGSGIVAFPCKNYCRQCGMHINEYYDVDISNTKYIYDCERDGGCQCVNINDRNLCKFQQSYGEGSSYYGFLVKEMFYFGEEWHLGEDSFNMTFGCVNQETHLFYTQKVNGIIGLTKTSYNKYQQPIFEQMYEQKIIERKMFSLCLGKDGGYFQIGGYNGQSHLDSNIQWAPLLQTSAYKVQMEGIFMNNHFIGGSKDFNIGFLDSGTTFTYIPNRLFEEFITHFDWFCSLDTQIHCQGKRIMIRDKICFQYKEENNLNGPKNYFLSYPVLQFRIKGINDQPIFFKWFPSEYLYRDNGDQYCLAAEKHQRSSEVMMGGTFLRQNNVIFDIESNTVGYARASCNNDTNQVINEQELIDFGQKFDLNELSSSQNILEKCNHRKIESTTGHIETQINQQEQQKFTKVDAIYYSIIFVLLLAICVYCLCSISIESDEHEHRPISDRSFEDAKSQYPVEIELTKQNIKQQMRINQLRRQRNRLRFIKNKDYQANIEVIPEEDSQISDTEDD